MTDVVRVRDLRRTFGDGRAPRAVLCGVDFTVGAGEMVAVVGRSGSGKTTLLQILGALDSRFDGTVDVLGHDVGRLSDDGRAALRSRDIGFVFQTFHLLDHLSAADNVRLPALLAPGGAPPDLAARAAAALARVGLADRAAARPAPLSGGERQRLAIARALVLDPKLVLADEPTGNLDVQTGGEVMALLRGLANGDRAVVVVTHDASIAAAADRTLTLVDGRLAGGGGDP